ncbi:MAG: hypothetical protein ACFE7I_09815, partial [Candidatus Hodarchaeota archaeon]
MLLAVLCFMLGWTAYSLPALIVGIREMQRRKRSDGEEEDYEELGDLPFFSLIVPMKDEEKVAGRILSALVKADYPS